jgi:hypothetical protein
MMKNYTWKNKKLRITRQRRTPDGKNEESSDRRKVILEGIILKPHDRRQNSDPDYQKPERRSGFDRRSIFDRRKHYRLWLKSKLSLISEAA